MDLFCLFFDYLAERFAYLLLFKGLFSAFRCGNDIHTRENQQGGYYFINAKHIHKKNNGDNSRHHRLNIVIHRQGCRS